MGSWYLDIIFQSIVNKQFFAYMYMPVELNAKDTNREPSSSCKLTIEFSSIDDANMFCEQCRDDVFLCAMLRISSVSSVYL